MSVIARLQIEAPTRERRLCTILRFQPDESSDWQAIQKNGAPSAQPEWDPGYSSFSAQ